MDIEILLILQEFRSGIGGNLAAFFSKMTFLGEIPTVMLLMGIIYWSVSREIGTFLMLGWSGNRLLNGALKVTVCAYRPWIRDSRVIPYGDSMTTATGYSFPSGHSTNSASLYGGLMIRKDMRASLRIVMGLLVLLVPLSRLFLGVHTPQDVLAGTAAGLLVMWAALRVTGWLKENPGKEWIPALTGLVLAAAVAVYAGVKTYPEDYVDTVLIVDGMKMARDTFKGAGGCCGFLVGWILERRFVGFSTDVAMGRKASRASAGILGFYAVNLIIAPLVNGWIGGFTGAFMSLFIPMLYVSFIYPWCFSRAEAAGERLEAMKTEPEQGASDSIHN